MIRPPYVGSLISALAGKNMAEQTDKKQHVPVDKHLKQAIRDYLQWMISNGYAQKTRQDYNRMLRHFSLFVKDNRFDWSEIFTLETLNDFQQGKSKATAHAVRGLCRYLFEQKRIPQPIQEPIPPLPEIYEQYLSYYARIQQVQHIQIVRIRRVLFAFHDYLERFKINLVSIRIEHIDAFMAEFNKKFAPQTKKTYRTYLRGFLKYLYHERRIIRKDLAPLVVGAPLFAQSKPPTFLRLHEVQKLFDTMDLSSPTGLRTNAMLELAYNLGLRPKEICLITLDDILFSEGELIIGDRKNTNPMKLPLPESTIKAIAAYIIGARPENDHRTLFLSLKAPYGPITPVMVNHHLKIFMRKANLPSTAYWLRHTYAQNLLEAGASIYEIKEMLGHDSIESSRKYLHIHINLMRKVLFDEEL